MVKLIKLKELQKFSSRLTASCSPPYGNNTMGSFYLNLFLGSELYLLTLHKRQVGQGNHGSPSKSFCVNATAVNCIRWHYDNAVAYRFNLKGNRLVKKAYAEIERKCTSSAFTCIFPTMTVMTDKSSRQILPVAYKKR